MEFWRELDGVMFNHGLNVACIFIAKQENAT